METTNKLFYSGTKSERYIVHERKNKIPQRRWDNR